MLDWVRGQSRAEGLEHGFALLAVGTPDVDLDQLVALEVDFDLVQHGVGQPLVADHHDGVQPVRSALEDPALTLTQFVRHSTLDWIQL